LQLIAKYDDALASFEEALLYMRGNQTMYVFRSKAPLLTCSNYEQLGLTFRLFSAEIYFNIGLTKIYIGQIESGMADLLEAQKEKQVPEHEVIDDAIRDTGRDYTVFSIPVSLPLSFSLG
jgi:neutrophil factor 2